MAWELKKQNLCPDPGAAQLNQNLGVGGGAGAAVTAALQVPLMAFRPKNRAQHRARWLRPASLDAARLVQVKARAHTLVKVPVHGKVAIANRQTSLASVWPGILARVVAACGRSRAREAIAAVLQRRPRL